MNSVAALNSSTETSRAPRSKRILPFLIRRRGDRRWDLILRAAGLAALTGIPLVVVFPESVPLVWLALVGLATNSPLSPVLPTAFEPILIEVAKYEPPIAVTLVALASALYMEFLNREVFRWVLGWERLTALREHRWVKRSVASFGRFPFWTVVVFAFAPLPFWVVRCLAVLRHYSLSRYLWATGLGRFFRYYLYAWLGATVNVPTLLLLAVIVGGIGVALLWTLLRRKRPAGRSDARADSAGTSMVPDPSGGSLDVAGGQG